MPSKERLWAAQFSTVHPITGAKDYLTRSGRTAALLLLTLAAAVKIKGKQRTGELSRQRQEESGASPDLPWRKRNKEEVVHSALLTPRNTLSQVYSEQLYSEDPGTADSIASQQEMALFPMHPWASPPECNFKFPGSFLGDTETERG